MRVQFLLLLSSACFAHAVQKRGVVEEMGNLFKGFHSSIDHIQRQANVMEQEMRPAMARAEEQLGSVLDNLGLTFGNERIDNHALDTSGMPGLSSLLGARFDPFSLFGLTRQNWWEGPNVCVERKVMNETAKEIEEDKKRGKFFAMDMTFTSCRDDVNFHECTTHMNNNGVKKSVTERYQCCFGYQRSTEDGVGCSAMVMEDIDTTMRNIGATEFTQLLTEAGVDKDFAKDNVTIFVPSDEAIEAFRNDLLKLNTLDNEKGAYAIDDGLADRKKRDVTIIETPALEDILKGHIVPGIVDTADVHDEDILETINGHQIRMTIYNTYPQRAVMANCAKVTSRDHYSTNGVVHMVDKVMMPATKTVKEMVESDPQFSSLKDALTKANLMEKLGQPGQWSLLAPTNEAFASLDAEAVKKIGRGNGCSKDILLNHLLPNVICSGVIEAKAKTLNVNDKYLILERTEEDVITVESEAKIVARDIMGTNGVIHVIDKVLIPDTAQTVDEVLEENQMTTLKELFTIAGMDMDTMSNMTIFAPSEKALSKLPKEFIDDLKSNKDKLKDFLMYHITTPKTCQCEMSNNKLLKTGLEKQSLRINTYGGAIPMLEERPDKITVQCARITNMDEEVCGGMIHTVDKVLMPPIGNLIDLIRLDPKSSTWYDLVKYADLDQELNTLEGPVTMLAPTNGAFDNMDDELKKEIFADKATAAKVVKHHILKEMLCCDGISKTFMFFDQSTKFTMLDNDYLSVKRSSGGYLYADRAELTTCDMVANNGVVHSIDRVLLPIGVGRRIPQERSMRRQINHFNPMEFVFDFN